MYDIRKITQEFLKYFVIHRYEIHPDCGAINQYPRDQRGHIPEVVLVSAVMKLVKQLQEGLALAAHPTARTSTHAPLPGQIDMNMGRIWRISISTAAVDNHKTEECRGVQPRASVIISKSRAACRSV